jgi:hypothetical protein
MTALLAALGAFFRAFIPALPYLLLAVIGFGSGYELRNLSAMTERMKMQLDQNDAIQKLNKTFDDKLLASKQELTDLRAAMQAEVAKAQAQGDVAAADLALELQQANDQSRKLQKDLSNAKARALAAGRPVCHLSNEWVRLYNAPLQARGSGLSAAGGTTDPAGRTLVLDFSQRDSGINEWDVSELHAENARRWSACRTQLNTLIDTVEGIH